MKRTVFNRNKAHECFYIKDGEIYRSLAGFKKYVYTFWRGGPCYMGNALIASHVTVGSVRLCVKTLREVLESDKELNFMYMRFDTSAELSNWVKNNKHTFMPAGSEEVKGKGEAESTKHRIDRVEKKLDAIIAHFGVEVE